MEPKQNPPDFLKLKILESLSRKEESTIFSRSLSRSLDQDDNAVMSHQDATAFLAESSKDALINEIPGG